MKLAIMQPYFVPYIGYWQLMNAVDKYVVYDDVNYINRGWINRNRIVVNGEIKYFNVPIIGASQNKKINEIYINHDKRQIDKNLRMLELSYKKAPFFETVYTLMKNIMYSDKQKLSEYLFDSLKSINEYIGIETELLLSSSIKKDNSLKGQSKIIEICKLLGASEYYNAIGGKALYSQDDFKIENIKLSFLETEYIEYTQGGKDFIPWLSIVDVMMFNSAESVNEMLTHYRLV